MPEIFIRRMRSDTIDMVIRWAANINHDKLTKLESIKVTGITDTLKYYGYIDFKEREFLKSCYEKTKMEE